MAKSLYKCAFVAASAGTVDFVVDASVSGFSLPDDADAEDGLTYEYTAVVENSTDQFEVGFGKYTALTGTVERTSIVCSSNDNAKVDFVAAPTVLLRSAINYVPAEIVARDEAAGTYTVTNETVLLIDKTSPAAHDIQLPAVSARNGIPIIIKDYAGNAAANNATIKADGSETIDGAATKVIITDFGGCKLVPVASDGAWYSVAETSPTPKLPTLIAVATPNNANAASAGVGVGEPYCDTANPCHIYVRTA